MIFELDKKQIDSIALKDDKGALILYGELVGILNNSKDLLPPRSLVLILGGNEATDVTFLLACLHNKWVPILINEDLDEELVNNYIKIYNPNAIFSSKSEINGCIKLIEWQDKFIAVLSHNLHASNEELSLLLPTSGSTGSPKLVRHSYNNLEFSSQSVSSMFNLNQFDIGLALLPIYYTMGLSVVFSHLKAGAQVYLSKYSLTDRAFWNILKNEGITVLTGVPYTFEVLFKMRFEKLVIPSLRIITQGGGKITNSMWSQLANYAKNNGLKFIPTYGQTEGTARMAFLDHKMVYDKTGSIGKAIPGGTFEVWDENNKPILEQETQGELVFKGKNVTLGYAENLTDLQKEDERKGILLTGDIVKRDIDGFYFIIGRKNRFLKIFGLRISLDELELFIKNEFNLDCFINGSDESLNIYVNQQNLEEKIKLFISKKINLHHQVVNVQYVSELPRSKSGKIMLNQIQKAD